MKNLSKLIALVIFIALILSISVSAENNQPTSTSQKITISGYADNDAVINCQLPDTYTIIFADYDAVGKLSNVKFTIQALQYGINTVTIPEGISFDNGDKIFVWNLLKTMSPVCEAYIYKINAPDDSVISALVKIPARNDFSFRYDTKNVSVGEESPIIQDYYLSKYKVTNAQYKAFIDATKHRAPSYWKDGTFPNGKDNHPVLNVSYSDATAYCGWLSTQYENYAFRLPTEAEWENAAMGNYYGNTSVKYPSGPVTPSYNSATWELTTTFNFNGVIASKLFREYGSDYTVNYIKGEYSGTSETLGQCISISSNGGVSNWADHDGETTRGYFLQTDLYAKISADGGYTTPVGTYPANTYGLYDMAGNCWDLTSSLITAINGLEAGVSCYAVRGGSWYATSRSCTFSYRGEGRKDSPSSTVGFRVAADYIE